MIIEEGDYDDTITGVAVGEDWLMSEFLAPTTDAMRQTTTIRTKIEEEKKQRGLDSTSRSIISDIRRTHSRPITPTKSNSKIPFIDDGYMKSPMRTRDRIPRTPFGPQNEEGNDFKNDDNSQLDISIGKKDNPVLQAAPSFGNPQKILEKANAPLPKEEVKDKDYVAPQAFESKDKIPRTPPQMKSKKYQKPPPEEQKVKQSKVKADKKVKKAK